MDYNICVSLEDLNILNRCIVEPDMKLVLENCQQNYNNILQLLTHLSVQKSDFQALQFLVETKGADVINDLLPAVYACQFGETEMFLFLISKGTNIFSQSLGFMILACMSKSFEILKIIFDMYEAEFANTDFESGKEEYANNHNLTNDLHETNDLNDLNDLNESTEHENPLQETKDTLLIICALSFYHEAVQFLLEFGADPYTNDNIILKKACSCNDIRLLQIFLDSGLRIDFNGHLNLSYAASKGYTQIMKMLLDNGVDVKVFHLAGFVASIESNNIESLHFLFSYLHNEKKMDLTQNEVQFLLKKCEPCGQIAMYLLQKYNIAYETQFPFDIEISKECPVCLEIASLILPCRHTICSSCLVSLKEKSCPFCRLQFDSNFIKRIHLQ